MTRLLVRTKSRHPERRKAGEDPGTLETSELLKFFWIATSATPPRNDEIVGSPLSFASIMIQAPAPLYLLTLPQILGCRLSRAYQALDYSKSQEVDTRN